MLFFFFLKRVIAAVIFNTLLNRITHHWAIPWGVRQLLIANKHTNFL